MKAYSRITRCPRTALVVLLFAAVAAAATPPFSFSGLRLSPFKNGCNTVLGFLGFSPPFRISGTAQELLERSGVTLDNLIAEGAMGVVYQASATGKDGKHKHLIVKQAMPGAEAEQALRDEQAVLAKVRPGTSLLLTGEDGSMFLVAEMVPIDAAHPGTPAPSLEKLLFTDKDPRFAAGATRDGALIDNVAMTLVREIAPITAAGFAHCDIKPANVLVSNGKAVIIDFGLAKAKDYTSTNGTVHGTLMYMDGPSLKNRPVNQSRDVHATLRTLERLYFRDAYVAINEWDGTGYLSRRFYTSTAWRELLITPEDGQSGVKAEVAWIVRSRSILDAPTLERLLEKAQKSKSMDDFLVDYRKVFEATWAEGSSSRRAEMLMELLSKPRYGPAFFRGLKPETQRELRALARAHQRLRLPPTHLEEPPSGPHPAIDPSWLIALP